MFKLLISRPISCISLSSLSNYSKNVQLCNTGKRFNLLKVSQFNNFDKKHYSASYKEINERVEQKLKIRDNIPNDFQIIYRAPLLAYMKSAYTAVFISTTTLPTIVGTSVLISGIQQFPIYLGGIPLMSSIYELFGFIAATGIVIIQISAVVFKYPLRIYTNKDRSQYIAVYQHLLPWKNQNEPFAAGEMKKTHSYMPWKHAMYGFRKRKAIIIEESFTRPVELDLMVGGDRISEEVEDDN